MNMKRRGVAAGSVVVLLLRILWEAAPSAASASAADPVASPLKLVASVETAGNAGFEAFHLPSADGNGEDVYLAAANFWDGVSRDMSAESAVFKVAVDASAADSIALERVQTMRTKGAHGWDFFETAHHDQMLVVPNYYGCGSQRGPATMDCKSTSVYRWNTGKRKFVRSQRLMTAGPGQTDHFLVGGDTYLVVGENFDNKVTIWKDVRRKSARLKNSRAHGNSGAGATAICRIDESTLFLVASSYHSGKKNHGWSTSTPVFQWSSAATKVSSRFPCSGLMGRNTRCSVPLFRGHYLFLSEDRDNAGSKIESKVMIFDHSTNRYAVSQRLPTDGAHAAEFLRSVVK